MDDFVR